MTLSPAADLASAPASVRAPTEVERLRHFGEALDALKERTEKKLGATDVRYAQTLDLFSRALEALGRICIHISFEPILFSIGVFLLFVHKQLQATELGHTVLHGAYDKLPDAEGLRSKGYWWDTPIDEESWHHGHNVRHHGATNVAGKDADIHFGLVRLTDKTPFKPAHRLQVPYALLLLFPNFAFFMNLHFTGVADTLFDNGLASRLDFLPDRTEASERLAWRRALRKLIPYYVKEYVVFPLLAGPYFWKVALGNYLAATLRDVYSAATIFCGHVGEDVASYEIGARPRHRGEWYAMQVEATNDFEVPRPISILCGGLDRQIEHHLFPKLPPERLREIAPEVRAICEAHGVRYKTASWGATLRKAFAHISALSRPSPRDVMTDTRALLRTMA